MTLWDVIAWIIMGALVGWIASMIMGTNARQGGLANIIVGIIGAFVGGRRFASPARCQIFSSRRR